MHNEMRIGQSLTSLEGDVVGDAEVLEHVGVAGERRRRRSERQEGGAGGEEDSTKLCHD